MKKLFCLLGILMFIATVAGALADNDRYDLKTSSLNKLKYIGDQTFSVIDGTTTLNISSDKHVDINVKKVPALYDQLSYEWDYIYAFDGNHPKITLSCSENMTVSGDIYLCGRIQLDMSTPLEEVNISKYAVLVEGQSDKIKFKQPKVTEDETEPKKKKTLEYDVDPDYDSFEEGHVLVVDPIIVILEPLFFDNSTYTDARNENGRFSHLELTDEFAAITELFLPFDIDTGSTAYDYSGNDNDGVSYLNITFINRSMKVDPQGYLELDGVYTSNTSDWWIYVKLKTEESFRAGSTYPVIIASHSSSYTSGYELKYETATNSFYVTLGNASTQYGTLAFYINDDQQINSFLFYYNSTSMRLKGYRNGILNQTSGIIPINGLLQTKTRLGEGFVTTSNFTIYDFMQGNAFPSSMTEAEFAQCLHLGTCEFYKTTGTVLSNETTIGKDYQRLTLTIDDFFIPENTSIEARILQGSTYSPWQSVSGNVNSTRSTLTFSIDPLLDSLQIEYRLNSTDGFLSPILVASQNFILETSDLAPPASATTSRNSIFSAFAIISLIILASAGFALVQTINSGDAGALMATVIMIIALAIVVMVGYLIIGSIPTTLG